MHMPDTHFPKLLTDALEISKIKKSSKLRLLNVAYQRSANMKIKTNKK